jgi:hypothetical protein
MALFESLPSDDPERAGVRYVLALVLLRRKHLVLVGSESEEDGEYLVMQRRGEEDSFRVRVVDLSESQIQAAQEQLAKVVRIE